MKNEYAIMKVAASILVVAGHVIIFYSNTGGIIPMQTDQLLDFVMRFIYSFHMPLFMFVSGAVYHICISAGKYKNAAEFMAKKFKSLIIPYLIWGVLYVTPVMMLLRVTDQSPAEYIVEGILLCRNSRHLWFIWALFFVSLGIRFLKPVIERGKVYRLLMLAVFLIAWYLSWNLTDLFGINSIIRYFLWYYMGYLFDGQKQRIDSVINRNKKITIAVSILSILIIVLYLQTGNNLWTGLAAAGAGIVLSYCAAASMKSFIFASKIYRLLERNCFGIYLAHPMIVYVCFYYFRGWMKNPCITSITVTLVALTVSTLITEALRKLRLKAVLGEAA